MISSWPHRHLPKVRSSSVELTNCSASIIQMTKILIVFRNHVFSGGKDFPRHRFVIETATSKFKST